MGYTLVTAVLCLAILRLSEGEGGPSITDGNTQEKEIAENVADGGEAFTLTSDAPALYTLTGTDAASFTVSPTTEGAAGGTATVSIKTSPVYASKLSYSLNVVATVTAGTTDVAVNLNVIKTPAFTATTFTVTLCDGATATTAVTTTGQLTATGHTERTLVYAIASGNTASDLSISTTTGQITVATSKTLMSATTATYTLVVTAGDSTAPAQTGTTTVTVNVGCFASVAINIEGANPVITGGSPQSKDIAENLAAAGSVIALTSDAAALFTLTGTDATSFAVTPTTGTAALVGTVTINASPVFSTKSSYTLNVVVTVSPTEATTVALTVYVIKTPAFTSDTFTVTPCDGVTAPTAVTTTGQLTATGHTERTLVYAIASGNTAADLLISATTGQITVANGKTLVKATTYTLVVTAGDSTAPAQTGTTTVTVKVGCNGSAAITGRMAALLCMVFSIIQKLA